TLLAGKQDKEVGKGLSTNDFTDTDKAKVDALKTVATTGSYNDLTDKPTIPSFAMTKTVTVDYLQNADTVQWTNLYGNITVNYVAGVNVATLKVSHGSVLEQVVPMGSASINIDSNEVVTMKITRTSDLQDSCVSMRFGERTA
ncbi:MAG: hypothetical protein IIZ88_07090, partial [Prevotella sp.]|nr:hypothetical protein [Prevotella sp.]